MIFKIPREQGYFIRLKPDVDAQSKFISVQMRILDNPFRGFTEYSTMPDQSMNNVYMRPVVFSEKSFIIYYYLSGFLEDKTSEESKKVMYAFEVSHVVSVKSAPSFLDPQSATLAKKLPQDVLSELRDSKLTPV